jgi:hypothetical protein
VEIGTEAGPKKGYINGIFVAVYTNIFEEILALTFNNTFSQQQTRENNLTGQNFQRE